MVDQLGLEVGYRLIPLVDHAQNGELLHRIRSLRKKFAQDVGFLPPVVHIRDNLELKLNDYRILLSGVEGAMAWPCPANGWRSTRGVTMQIKGTPTTDPASACRRCGSTALFATRRRWPATRWWMPARSWPPI